MDSNEQREFILAKVRELGEHFDSVQIFAQVTEQGETYTHKHGSGSWHARLGMAHEMIETDRARIHLHTQRTEYPDDGL